MDLTSRQRSLVRAQHRPLLQASFCRQNAIARRGLGLTSGLFYTSPITAAPMSAGAALAPGSAAGWEPCEPAASGPNAGFAVSTQAPRQLSISAHCSTP